jgi:hypothetical protein
MKRTLQTAMEKENVNLMAIDKKLIDQLLAERSQRSEAVRKEKTDVGHSLIPRKSLRPTGGWARLAHSCQFEFFTAYLLSRS